mgnify:CR=1 FL=1
MEYMDARPRLVREGGVWHVIGRTFDVFAHDFAHALRIALFITGKV